MIYNGTQPATIGFRLQRIAEGDIVVRHTEGDHERHASLIDEGEVGLSGNVV